MAAVRMESPRPSRFVVPVAGVIGMALCVAGILVRVPAEWRVSVDGQYARNVVQYRGLAGVDPTRWQGGDRAEVVRVGEHAVLDRLHRAGDQVGTHFAGVIGQDAHTGLNARSDHQRLQAQVALRQLDESLGSPGTTDEIAQQLEGRRL